MKDLNEDVMDRMQEWLDRVMSCGPAATTRNKSKRSRKRPRTKPLLSCFKTRMAFFEHMGWSTEGVGDEPEHIHVLQVPGEGFSFWTEDE